MSYFKVLIGICLIFSICGCSPSHKTASKSKKVFLTVDFEPNQVLKYKYISNRNMAVDWGPMRGQNPKDTKISKSSESLEMIVAYTPLEVDPYGISTIKADCLSAKVRRNSESARQAIYQDAAETFAGKSWTFTIDARGKMLDRSKFVDVLHQVGQRAFRSDKSKGLIKDPDMLYDILATQYFMWDSISSINKPAKGVAVGDKWKSVLEVPATMILFAARDVNYTIAQVRQDPNSRIAVINSSYSLLWPRPSEWPVPYTEIFQMSGTFGFLREYKVQNLNGIGQDLFNIDKGVLEKSTQSYTLHLGASLPMGLGGVTPKITIDQNITTELIEPSVAKN